ncbi:MAG: response regulator [Campylobacterales bacterium]
MGDCDDLKHITLLYAEDEEIIREMLAKFLRRRFKEVWLADNGAKGVEIFLEKRPDIVLTDIEMPIMNGVEMIAKIKEIDTTIPCIVVTAYRDEAHQSHLAQAVVYKPVDNLALLETIQRVCRNHFQHSTERV